MVERTQALESLGVQEPELRVLTRGLRKGPHSLSLRVLISDDNDNCYLGQDFFFFPLTNIYVAII